MMLVEETPVPAASLPVTTFREHLRMGTGFADDTLQDGLLERHLRAALAAVEARTAKILISRNFIWTLTAWRAADQHPLPVAPVETVSAVTLISPDGAETAVEETAWLVQAAQSPAALVSTAGVFPSIPRHGKARLLLTAGYGPTWEDVPADLAQAVLLLAAHFYEFRYSAESAGAELPFAVASLLAPYRSMRIFMGGRSS